jgi:hypothetical protein
MFEKNERNERFKNGCVLNYHVIITHPTYQNIKSIFFEKIEIL